MSAGDKVELIEGKTPDDYHCTCNYCRRVIGELRPADGSYYSRLERRAYYDASERGKDGHVAKTPLHVARWAVQRYTNPGDWVLDPTIGAGTTAVEALTQGRNVAGMELQFGSVLTANVKKNLNGHEAKIRIGDARTISSFLDENGFGIGPRPRFRLVVNNPPYSGDEHAGTGKMNTQPTKEVDGKTEKKSWTTTYQDGLPNLAFLKEGKPYWEALGQIYADCAKRLESGGHFVVAVKDMMRKKQPFLLHRDICELLWGRVDLEFVGTAFLKHHPTTLFLNTYEKWYGVKPPLYQTIVVFKKSVNERQADTC